MNVPLFTRHLARLTFVAFLLTFIAARTLVILIMTRKVPDLYVHLGGTHVHHLNCSIFLSATVAAVLLFAPLNAAQRSFCAIVYGVGMALTFDEFGLWLNLGGSYWQRASFRCRSRDIEPSWVAGLRAPMATDSFTSFRSRDRVANRTGVVWHVAHQIVEPRERQNQTAFARDGEERAKLETLSAAHYFPFPSAAKTGTLERS